MTQLGAKIKIINRQGRILFEVSHPVFYSMKVVPNLRAVEEFCHNFNLAYDREGLVQILAKLQYDLNGGGGWVIPYLLRECKSFMRDLEEEL